MVVLRNCEYSCDKGGTSQPGNYLAKVERAREFGYLNGRVICFEAKSHENNHCIPNLHIPLFDRATKFIAIRKSLQSCILSDTENYVLFRVENDLVVRFRPCHNCMENVVNLLKLSGGFLGRYAIGLLVAMKTEMVNMGMRLEDGVRTGLLTKEVGSSGGTKKYGSGFPKKKEHDAKPFT